MFFSFVSIFYLPISVTRIRRTKSRRNQKSRTSLKRWRKPKNRRSRMLEFGMEDWEGSRSTLSMNWKCQRLMVQKKIAFLRKKIVSDIASDAPPTTHSSSDLSTPQAIMSAYWAIPGPPLFHVDVKNLVKYVLHTCKCAASQLKNTRTSNGIHLSFFSFSHHIIYRSPLLQNRFQWLVRGTFSKGCWSTASSASKCSPSRHRTTSCATIWHNSTRYIFDELFQNSKIFAI